MPTPMHRRRHALSLLLLVTAAALTACGGGGGDNSVGATPAQSVTPAPTATSTPAPTPTPTDADRVAVGDKLFHDQRLSAAGNLACAGCHVQVRGHADAEGGFLPLGGAGLDQQGLRSSPSLDYLNDNRPFTIDNQGRPVGGFTWDGRADSRAAQALAPLLAANEMANTDNAAVVARVRSLSYFNELGFAFSLSANASDAQVLLALQQALQAYQVGDPDYATFSSKFDAVQAGSAAFNAQEARGLAAFNSPQLGNCASCHPSTPQGAQTRALFTNFGYFALGVPRNRSTATADPAFFDLGLCGPLRTDLANRTDLCGKFKVPTLRNVALTAPYFHNGALATLDEVVGFYATRDTDPGRWYPVVGGVVATFNDLPPAYRGNINQQIPFGLQPGQAPRLSAQQVQDIVAFLGTLTDGFKP